MASATTKRSANATPRDMDLFAGVIAQQELGAAEPFVSTKKNRVWAKYWILLLMLLN